MRISILLNCNLNEKVLNELKEHLKRTFRLETTEYYYKIDLSFSYDERRKQYLGDKIIERLTKNKKDPGKWLLILDVDIYADDLNFIFGLADPSSGIAIISLTRLKQEIYGLRKDESLFLERLKKEATHELGHLFGIGHCPDKRCVMRFSNSLYDTDEKLLYFCESCKRNIKFYRK